MARFPRTEAEILELAGMVISGLAGNAAIYPVPPVAVPDLTAVKNNYVTAQNAAIAAKAAAEAATAAKNSAMGDLIVAVKSDIRYAENTVNYNDNKLKLIGWAGKKTPVSLAPPGQAGSLEAPRQGDGWVFLDWKAPVDGGTMGVYKVMRRELPAGEWEDAAMAFITEATLVEQPVKTELEYRVTAINKAGEGLPGNAVMVVL